MTRIIGWLLVAFAAYYLFTNPDGAAALVHGILNWLEHFASSLSSFAGHL
jgi:hypothetical protein